MTDKNNKIRKCAECHKLLLDEPYCVECWNKGVSKAEKDKRIGVA